MFGRTNIRPVKNGLKDALDGDISVELIPFSDLKPRTNKYILKLWQSDGMSSRKINYIRYSQN